MIVHFATAPVRALSRDILRRALQSELQTLVTLCPEMDEMTRVCVCMCVRARGQSDRVMFAL